jgi:hypothetical protein
MHVGHGSRKTQLDTPVAHQPCSDDTALLTEWGVGQINVICVTDGDVAMSHKYVLRLLCHFLLSITKSLCFESANTLSNRCVKTQISISL